MRGLKIQTARKDHWCSLCRRRIPKGVRYFREQSDVQGAWDPEREHTNCEEFKDQPEKPL